MPPSEQLTSLSGWMQTGGLPPSCGTFAFKNTPSCEIVRRHTNAHIEHLSGLQRLWKDLVVPVCAPAPRLWSACVCVVNFKLFTFAYLLEPSILVTAVINRHYFLDSQRSEHSTTHRAGNGSDILAIGGGGGWRVVVSERSNLMPRSSLSFWTLFCLR